MSSIIREAPSKPVGKETIAVNSIARGLTESLYSLADYCLLDFRDKARVWFDGTDPTSTEGHRYQAFTYIELYHKVGMANFRQIKDSGAAGDSDIAVSYFKYE